MHPLRASVALLVLAVAAVGVAAPASAHARWLGMDPAEGSVLSELPAEIVMTYDEEIAAQFVDTALVPPGGEPITTEAGVDGVDVVIDVAGSAEVAEHAGAAGEWQVVARVVSVDGHPVEHTSTFELEPAPAPSPAAGGSVEETAAAAPVETSTGPAPSTEPSPAPSTEPDSTPAAEDPATVASAEPSVISGDPVSGVAGDLPGWLVPLVVLAALGAGAAAVVVHLRRRPPEV